MLPTEGLWIQTWPGVAGQTLDICMWLQVDRFPSNLSDFIVDMAHHQTGHQILFQIFNNNNIIYLIKNMQWQLGK